ncbi:MAG TPA: hypothetical protein VMT51_09180 [Dongiaceae bacterium]|nr:hypothetical protein [Dongiaceae bacterium]
MFRKRLLKQTMFFLAGSLLFPYVTPIYPPLDLDLMLVFFGLLFFVALAIVAVLDRRARKHQEIEILKRVYAGFVPLPWILAAAILLNGKLDTSSKVVYVPERVQGKFVMKGLVRGSRRLVVPSWRPGQKVERVAVDADDFDRFRVGDNIEVAVQPGVLGIPWVYGVYREGRPTQ